jgi:hypothetical protein
MKYSTFILTAGQSLIACGNNDRNQIASKYLINSLTLNPQIEALYLLEEDSEKMFESQIRGDNNDEKIKVLEQTAIRVIKRNPYYGQ